MKRYCWSEGGRDREEGGTETQTLPILCTMNIPSSSMMTTMVCGIAPLRAPVPFTKSKSTLKPSSLS